MSAILIPSKTTNSWSYGFDLMDIGDVLHCPYNPSELQHRSRAGSRVHSAFSCWKQLNPTLRSHIKMKAKSTWHHIKLTRIA